MISIPGFPVLFDTSARTSRTASSRDLPKLPSILLRLNSRMIASSESEDVFHTGSAGSEPSRERCSTAQTDGSNIASLLCVQLSEMLTA